MLGREAVERDLANHIAEAATGPLTVQLLTGPAGIGKTSVIKSVLAARSQHVLAMTCEADELDQLIPYSLLDSLALAARATPGLDAQLIDELASATMKAPGLESGDRAIALGRWFRGVVQRHGQVIVVWEDIHNLDGGSIRVLSLLLRSIRDLPIAVAMTSRSGFDDRIGDVIRLIRRMEEYGSGTVTVLEALSEGVIKSLAERALGREVERPILRDVAAASAGNPFLVEQLLSILARTDAAGSTYSPFAGDASRAGRYTTESSIVLSRFFPVSDDRLEVARLLSIFRGPINLQSPALAELFAASGIDSDRAAAAADALIESGVVVRNRETTCQFVHPLVRDALYASLGFAHRTKLHRLIAGSLEAAEGTGRDVFEIASNYRLGGVVDSLATAATMRAASAAEQTGPSAAVFWLEASLQLLDESSPERRDVYFRLLCALLAAWLPRDASQVAQRATDEFGANPDSFYILLPSALAHLYSGNPEWMLDALDSVDFDEADPLTRSWLEGIWSICFYFVDEPRKAAEAYARYPKEVPDPSEPTALASVLTEVALVAYTTLSGSGEYFLHVDRCRALFPLIPSLNRREIAANVAYLELLGPGRLRDARALLAEAHERPLAGRELSLFGGANATAWVLLQWFEGDLRAAHQLARSATQELEAVGGLMLLGGVAAFDALLCLELGLTKDARSLIPLLVGRHPGDAGFVTLARARLDLSEGKVMDARAALVDHVKKTDQSGAVAGTGPVVEELVRLELSLGNLGPARELAARHFSRVSPLDWPIQTMYALRARGTATGDVADLQAARMICGELGLKFEVLVCELRLGEFLEDASESLTSALKGFRRMGAFASERRTRAEMRRRGIPIPRERGHDTNERLRPRRTDQQIVSLISQGLTNRAIAQALHISVKTVEHHLSLIYSREGVRSRVELVAKMLASDLGRHLE